MDQPSCPFCADAGSVLANDLVLARWDANPVTPGQLLIIARRQVADFFDTSSDERRALLELPQQARDLLQREHRPDSFTIGINVGEAAGQTMARVHIHLIPRYRGDTPRPRGGGRGVIPDKQSY